MPASTLPTVPAWWRAFGDAELDALVQEGLAANHDRASRPPVDEFSALVVAPTPGPAAVGYGAGPDSSARPVAWCAQFFVAAVGELELDLCDRIRREKTPPARPCWRPKRAPGRALTLVSAIVSAT